MAVSVTVRRAQLADRSAMRSLLTTAVGGTSPLDELTADYGAAMNFSLADLQTMIQNGQAAVLIAIDAGSVMRGWVFFLLCDGLTPFGVPATVAWQCLYTVTDKSLVAADRLAVAGRMFHTAAANVPNPDTTYIWGDIKTPGNLDTFVSGKLSALPQLFTVGNAQCHRYYGTATQLMGVF